MVQPNAWLQATEDNSTHFILDGVLGGYWRVHRINGRIGDQGSENGLDTKRGWTVGTKVMPWECLPLLVPTAAHSTHHHYKWFLHYLWIFALLPWCSMSQRGGYDWLSLDLPHNGWGREEGPSLIQSRALLLPSTTHSEALPPDGKGDAEQKTN